MGGKKYRGDRDADVIIIGTGLGGLTAGAYLAKQGLKVLLFEQHRQPGGYFTTFKHKGYAFDGGIQGCEDAGMLLNLFKHLGLEQRIRFCKSRYALCMGDFQAPMSTVPDIARLYEALALRFPADAAALREIGRDACDFSHAIEAFGAMPDPLLMSMGKAMVSYPGWIAKYGRYLKFFPRFFKYVSTPMEDYFEERLTDPELKRILGMISYRGTPASFGLSFMSYFLDYYYSDGGVQAIPDVLAGSIEERGGLIEYRALVDEILLEGKRACGVRLADGRVFRAPFVVNNGDARRTYEKMLPASAVPERFRKRLEGAELAESAFTVFLGLDIPPQELHTMDSHHILVYPDAEPAGQSWEALPELYRYSFMEISVPSLHDPSLAPPGKSAVILHSLASADTAGWGIVELKEQSAELLIERADRIIPGLREHIEVKLTATPYTHERYTLNAGGTTVGWTYHPGRGFFRHFMPMHGFLTPVKNLYQVGHWAMTPGGAPSAIITGRIVAGLVGARLKLGV
jgi:phytoene dehydrogenase-like protein